jgi:hypothetical protein
MLVLKPMVLGHPSFRKRHIHNKRVLGACRCFFSFEVCPENLWDIYHELCSTISLYLVHLSTTKYWYPVMSIANIEVYSSFGWRSESCKKNLKAICCLIPLYTEGLYRFVHKLKFQEHFITAGILILL